MAKKFNKSGLDAIDNQQSMSYRWQNEQARATVLQRKQEGATV